MSYERFPIVSGLPIPPVVRMQVTGYRFACMQVGDSFPLTAAQSQAVKVAAARYKRAHAGWNYTCRQQADGSYRLWRIA